MTSPDRPFIPIDREDQETDKLGSVDLGQHRLYGESVWASQSSTEGENKRPLTSAQRKRLSLLALGPQFDEPNPVVDQTRSPAEYVALREHARPLADELFEKRIQRIRAQASENGVNPGAMERAAREKRERSRRE